MTTNPRTPPSPTILIGRRASQQQPLRQSLDRPRLIGNGPPESSVEHALDRQPFCWDCNGFYRRLGLPPGAPRIEVARNFLEMQGYRSSWLTNAARVLTNKSTKRAYDVLSIGTFWPDDESLIEAIISNEMVCVHNDEGWSFYVIGDIDPNDISIEDLSTWRFMISYLFWRAKSPVRLISMGVALDARAAVVGRRLVAFVPLTSKPSWSYASTIAEGMHRLIEPGPSA